MNDYEKLSSRILLIPHPTTSRPLTDSNNFNFGYLSLGD